MQSIEWTYIEPAEPATEAGFLHPAARRGKRARVRWNGPRLNLARAGWAELALDVRAVYLASFEVLLHRFWGQDEVEILVLTNAGDSPAHEARLATRIVRMDLGQDLEFSSLARLASSAFPAQLPNVAEPANGQVVSYGQARPCRAVFVYHQSDRSLLPLSLGTPPEAAAGDADPVGAELALIVEEESDTWQIGFDYDPNLISAALVQEIAKSYEALMASVSADPHQPISRLNLLTAEQRERIVHQWNNTAVEFPRAVHVELQFDRRAAESPDAIAVRHEDRAVTYGELRVRSNQLAQRLCTLGVGGNDRVAICLDRSPEMLVGLLGILKSGAAYVPLDPGYPPDRLAFMFADAGCAALVTQAGQWRPPALDVPVIQLDTDRQSLDTEPATDLAPVAEADDLAYVIYTSGSTGQPKGVAVRRAALTNCIQAFQHRLEMSDRDVLLAVTTISFDIAALELFLPLVAGARIVLATRDDAAQPNRLAQLVDQERVSVMQATPATWRMLLGVQWPGWSGLRVLCGGEAMTRDLADALLRRTACVWNVYGPTETTIWSTMCRLAVEEGPISIGRPIDNTQIYILDRHRQPVPVGAIGELYIGGDGLARDYLHRPELTAEKFIAHPFSADPDARIYRTGDLARYWPDGRIECLGRVDHQVKIRGFRIELGEIESRLSAHPAVQMAAAIARSDAPGDEYLAAYWAPRPGVDPLLPADVLRNFLAETLPRHMVPSVIVRLPELPMTPNGKIDRRALPAPQREAFEPSGSYAAPRNAMQRRLVELFEGLLAIRPVGIHDDFFALGGHSLNAARLITRIEAATGLRIPLASLASSPTVEGLARLLTGEVATGAGVIVPFRQTGSRPPLFLVAGVGGHVLIFRELATLLGDDQPVYGFQGIGLDGEEQPLRRMEQIAARYIEEMIAVRPQGPWAIGGWSMGGVIAFEMARQLYAQGQPPHAVVIVDAYAPWVVSWRERLRVHLAAFRRRPWRGRAGYLAQRITNRMNVLGRKVGIESISAGLDGELAARVRKSTLAQFEALSCYQPRPLEANIVLLRAEQTEHVGDPRSTDVNLGWNTLVNGHIDTVPIPGCHTGIFQRGNVEVLAETLSARLA